MSPFMEEEPLMEEEKRPAAAALQYEHERAGAPRVTASGYGVIAEQIVAKARQAGVPIYEDPALAAALCRLPRDTEIPPELYLAVARVLAFIFRLDQEKSG